MSNVPPHFELAEPVRFAGVDEAIASRKSIRRFTSTTVPEQVIADILRIASRAPSGTNTQPWQVHVVTGNARTRLTRAILVAYDDSAQRSQHEEEYAYYPRKWISPYVDRRRKVGWDLYALLGIGRDERERMHAQQGRNYAFFDAPVGLIFTIDRVLERGSWLDYGMFLQNIMIAARARGLDTCTQAAFTQFHQIIARELALPLSQMVVCGMALGFADPEAPENQLRTEREPVEAFARFHR